MKILRLNAALSTAFLTFLPCLHSSASALESDYPCFMITKSGRVVDLTNSVCKFKQSVPAVTADFTTSEQEFAEDYNSDGMDYAEETSAEASEEIQSAQVEKTNEGVDFIDADE